MRDETMKIAGYTVRFSLRHSLLAVLGKDYLCADAPFDFSICPTEEDLAYERRKAQSTDCPVREDVLEALACYRKFAEAIYPDYAFVMHGAAFCVNGAGVMFLAPSGTGKTTHMRLWQQMLGEKMTVINGDKPIVTLKDSMPVIYGTPFQGKEQYGCNSSAPLRHLCLISRSPENHTEPLAKKDALAMLLRQTHVPETPEAVKKALDFSASLLETCSFWNIFCNKDPQAAAVSYHTIFDKKSEG